ncbi:ATP-binding cassette sub-family B member 10, mitochondrial-like [Biomphalaria glabrata]|uniref:ATP-binding cassette sub-family B member 10, mitochondrial n=1 Tax=Biomphalaria glabrata TaxID=6526 RepID=A0A9W2ZV53_BIOGL|nr:ATP-binding cassette sub-family B member 10, mitochondrial-like [Biomphalaria glabrata]
MAAMIFTFVKPPHLHRTLNLCKNSTHFLQRMPLHSTKAVHIDNVFAACKLFSQRAKVRFNVQSNFHSLSRLRQHGGTILGSWPTRIFKRISRAANSQNVNKAQDKLSTSAKQGLNQMSVTNVAKPKNIKRLLALAKNEKWKLAGALLCLIVSSFVTLSVPYFIGKIVDLIYTTEKEKMVHKLTVFCSSLLGIFLIGGLANFGRVYIIQCSSQRIVKTLRELLFGKIMRQEVGFFDKTKTGELINRLSSDTQVVSQALSQNISDGVRSILQSITGLGMMVFISAKLTLISMCIVPPVAVGSIIYGRYLRKITKKVQDSLANATQVAEERIATIRTVRAFAHEDKECTMYNDSIDQVLQLSYKESLARAIFWGFAGFSGNVIIISVFYFGGRMMMVSDISVGDLSAFLMYAAYVGTSLNGITSFITELNRGVAASDRIWDIMDRKPLIELDYLTRPLKTLDFFKGNLRMNNVSFSYPSRSEMPIFTDMTLDIPSGSVTAIVGPSGSGKSTISSLLLRLYDPLSGSITLDGHDLRDLDPNWLRRNIGIVSQEPVLLSTSIGENIAYGAEKPELVSAEQIIQAAKQANAYNFIEDFPEGFATLVGERGMMLSGGQRQRVAIARAILKNPKILILDEATSALDAESEYQVQDALDKLMVGRTVLIIAHRLSTIKSADKIVVIDEGQVKESGSYDQLISLPQGLFKKLVERQTFVK